MTVGRAAGTELVPRGRFVEAQLTGCGREGGCRQAGWATVAGLKDSSHFDPGIPGGGEGDPLRDRGADLQNYPVLFSFAQGETKAERTCDLLGVVQQVESTAEAVTLTPESKPQS